MVLSPTRGLPRLCPMIRKNAERQPPSRPFHCGLTSLPIAIVLLDFIFQPVASYSRTTSIDVRCSAGPPSRRVYLEDSGVQIILTVDKLGREGHPNPTITADSAETAFSLQA